MSSSQAGQAKSFLFYCAVLLVAASSVAFGLDWAAAPLPPMPETEASVQAALAAARFPPPVQRVAKVESQPRVVSPARSGAPAPQVAAADPTAKAGPNVTATPSITAPEQGAAQPAAENAQPKCDVAACSAAYRSFRASDCSWQPFEGPRRLCDKGQPPQDTAAADTDAAADKNAATNQTNAKCDVEACKRAYFTFTPADCTYQPSNGPRRICDKGTPPKPDAAADAGAAAPGAAPATDDERAQAKPKCNVEACKQAYFTFNPLDCTYRPSDGPRRLCTK
jgi:hypothetical protein